MPTETKSKTFEEICAIDKMILALYQEAQSPQLLKNPNYCRYQKWHARPVMGVQAGGRQGGGEIGLSSFITERFNAPENTNKLNHDDYETVTKAIWRALPPCAKGDACRLCTLTEFAQAELTEEQKAGIAAGTLSVLARKNEPGMFGLIDMLRRKGKGKPIDLTPIHDENEPVFLVNQLNQAQYLYGALKIKERLEARELSGWYASNWVLYFEEDDRKKLLAAKQADLTGALLWKPIVMTFHDDALLSHLKGLGVAVTEIEALPESLEEFRKEKLVLPAIAAQRGAEEAVLDGKLGDIYRRYLSDFPISLAWPALVTAASTLVAGSRLNLYCGLVGPAGCGKSQVIERACKLLGVERPVLLPLKAGSAEGLAQKIGDVAGAHRLLFPDELAHLFAKANIENASFADVLNTAYYETKQEFTVSQRKEVTMNCSLSLAGGIVTDRFDEIFNVKTIGGLYDRFIFGLCPDGWSYAYKAFEDGCVLFPKRAGERTVIQMGSLTVKSQASVGQAPFGPVTIHPTVYEEVKKWREQLPKLGRVVEHAIRVATICAAIDGRDELHAEDLEPAFAFAKYQARVRALLEPNPGKNVEGILSHKFLNYLKNHATDGRWVSKRKMYDDTNAYDMGVNKADSALRGLEFNGLIETSTVKSGNRKQQVVRLVTEPSSW